MIVCTCGVVLLLLLLLICFFKRSKRTPERSFRAQFITTATPISGSSVGGSSAPQLYANGLKGYGTSMSITSNPTDTGDTMYDRNNITGASCPSQSTMLQTFHPSLLNPPPSPVTDRSQYTSISGKYCESRPPSTCQVHRQYRPHLANYPTPASTDIESSVSKYLYSRKQKTSSAYSSVCTDDDYVDDNPYAPPPTICTNYFSEGMQFSEMDDPPPSPNSEVCFAFEPDPPPPSPVTDSPSVA